MGTLEVFEEVSQPRPCRAAAARAPRPPPAPAPVTTRNYATCSLLHRPRVACCLCYASSQFPVFVLRTSPHYSLFHTCCCPLLQATPDAVYPGALETFDNLGRVVESLMGRTAKLTAGA